MQYDDSLPVESEQCAVVATATGFEDHLSNFTSAPRTFRSRGTLVSIGLQLAQHVFPAAIPSHCSFGRPSRQPIEDDIQVLGACGWSLTLKLMISEFHIFAPVLPSPRRRRAPRCPLRCRQSRVRESNKLRVALAIPSNSSPSHPIRAANHSVGFARGKLMKLVQLFTRRRHVFLPLSLT